jgi:hypothetical protein
LPLLPASQSLPILLGGQWALILFTCIVLIPVGTVAALAAIGYVYDRFGWLAATMVAAMLAVGAIGGSAGHHDRAMAS